MLLQKLNEYADRLKLPPQLYSETPIRYIIELDDTGRLTNASPTDTANPAESSARRGVRRLAPQVTRAVAIKPLLLADKSDYTFGLIGEDSKPKRVAECHACCVYGSPGALRENHARACRRCGARVSPA